MIDKGERWEDHAACKNADPKIFFPLGDHGQMTKRQVKAAKSWCRTCPVRPTCLSYALDNPEKARWGIWGGFTTGQRRMRSGRTSSEVRS